MLDDIRLINGDCLEVLDSLEAGSIDTCITDPPYGLGFMGNSWDRAGIAFNPDTWRRVRRVLKPGAFLLCFGGTRTFHRVTAAIEDGGFEIRDCMVWLYAQGLPKSYNLQIRGWRGWGTGLKPAWEPIVVAMKPLNGTFAVTGRLKTGHLWALQNRPGIGLNFKFTRMWGIAASTYAGVGCVIFLLRGVSSPRVRRRPASPGGRFGRFWVGRPGGRFGRFWNRAGPSADRIDHLAFPW